MDTRTREREKAVLFWASLSNDQRWALGDALVLGAFDWAEWMEVKPSGEFMRELDRLRRNWEV